MLSTWCSEGLAPDLFWRVTPRVFTAVMFGRGQANKEAIARDAALAWQIENFARTKRLPPLAKVLADLDKPVAASDAALPEISPEAMLEQLLAIDGGMGLMKFKFRPHSAEG